MNKRVFAFITALMTMVVLCGAPAVSFADDGSGVKKDETVYVVTDSTGTEEDVIVSEHLINNGELEKIKDETDLSNIENVKGDEKFKRLGNELVWEAKGSDIYYQGSTKAEIPVKMNVIYRLDGKEISGSKLQGKSGDVEIEIKYNNLARYGGSGVPIVVMTGLLVTDSCLTNIKVDNGKVIDDGEKQIVIGMAAPGVAQSLGMGDNELGLGDSVTITAKADKFAIEDMMSIATSSLFEDVNAGKFGNLNFDDQLRQLDNGSRELVKGTRILYSGINTMDSKKEELTSGVEKLDVGANSLCTNLDKIKGLINADAAYLNYVNGLINDQLPAMKQQSAALCSQLEDVSKTTENVNIKPIEKVEDVTDTSTIRADIEQLRALRDKAAEEDKAAYDKIIADMEKTAENESSIINQVNSKIEQANSEIQAGADALNSSNYEIAKAQDEASAAYIAMQKVGVVNSIINTPGTLGEGKPSWSFISKNLYGAFFSDGSTPTVLTGAKGLADGLEQLNDSTIQLSDGITQLDEGALKVDKGMETLYSQGIKKIVDLYNNDLKGLTKGLSGMLDAGQGYKSITKLPSGMDGSVKFVYKTKINE